MSNSPGVAIPWGLAAEMVNTAGPGDENCPLAAAAAQPVINGASLGYMKNGGGGAWAWTRLRTPRDRVTSKAVE